MGMGEPVDVADREREELWKASVRRHHARRDGELRAAWHAYHLRQAENARATLTALIQHHEQAAQKLGSLIGQPEKGEA